VGVAAKRGRYAFTVRAWEDGLFAEYYYLLPDEDARDVFREGSHPVLSYPVREELIPYLYRCAELVWSRKVKVGDAVVYEFTEVASYRRHALAGLMLAVVEDPVDADTVISLALILREPLVDEMVNIARARYEEDPWDLDRILAVPMALCTLYGIRCRGW